MAASTQAIELKEEIHLTEIEERIFQRLLEVNDHFNLETTLRVGGGWIRDKLLGQEPYDIDISLDNMMGREFCDKLNDYLELIGEERQRYQDIKSNSDRSKHVETSVIRLFGISIDIVNLRSESCSDDDDDDDDENCGVPTAMGFGTAEEDAYTRDLTINSLFYNINTKSIEDFTRRGLADLKSGIIATPLRARLTFLYDPLRVLRAFRFATRFGFVLDEELKEAAASNDVKAALVGKISKERIGIEIKYMISGEEPVQAMVYICDSDLFWAVFSPSHETEPSFEGVDRLCLAYITAAWSLLQAVGLTTFDDEHRGLYLYAAQFLPLRKTQGVIKHIFADSLKLKKSIGDNVLILQNTSVRFKDLIVQIEHLEEDAQRKMVYAMLRETRNLWRVSLLISALISATDNTENPPETPAELDRSLQLYKTVEGTIVGLGLENIWNMKPPINGHDIMSILQFKEGGRIVGKWSKRVREWQIAHPYGSAADCMHWMRKEIAKQKQ